MRSDKELVKVALENFTKYFKQGAGLCYYFSILTFLEYISINEEKRLTELIHKYAVEKYTLRSLFTNSARHIEWFNEGYFWDRFDVHSRKTYLKYIYKKLNNGK